MKTERICEAHLMEIADLERGCFHDPWSENALRLLITEQATGAVCVDEDGRVLAYGGMLWAPDEGQITNIAVYPKARRQGLGRAVLKALIRQAKDKGCHMLSLEVRASNEAAISLYASEGFAVSGRRKNFYRSPTEDALVMLLEWDE